MPNFGNSPVDFTGKLPEPVPSLTFAPPILGVQTSITAFVGYTASGSVNEPQAIASFASFQQAFGLLDDASAISFAVQQFFVNGGTQAVVVRTPSPSTADLIGDPTAATGLYALGGAGSFNLLCLPDCAALADADRLAVISAAISFCEQRSAFLLVDPPVTATTVAAASAWRSNLGNSPNAAAFFPSLIIDNPLSPGTPRTLAPCGTVAGLYARTDAAIGIWKAPAGVNASLTGVQSLACPLSNADNDALNLLGVNCFRIFPGKPPLLWGARTLSATPSDFQYVSVKRTALYIEQSIVQGTRWASTERNGPLLWRSLTSNIDAFLMTLFTQGALQGARPSEAYFIRCDATTTTQLDLDKGVVNVDIGFAPLKPAEFVILRISLRAAL